MSHIKVVVDGETVMDGGPQGWTVQPKLKPEDVAPGSNEPWRMTVMQELTTALNPKLKSLDGKPPPKRITVTVTTGKDEYHIHGKWER